MKPSRHNTPFRPGDRVTMPTPRGPDRRVFRGTFVGYCRGYLSHALVLWGGDAMPSRVLAAKLILLDRPTPEV